MLESRENIRPTLVAIETGGRTRVTGTKLSLSFLLASTLNESQWRIFF